MPITAVYYRPRAEMLSMPVPSQQESQSSGTSSASSQNDEIHPASMCCAHPTTSSLPQLKEIVRAIRSIRTISKEQVRSEPLKDLIKMLDQVEKMMTVERTQLTASGLDAIKKLGAYISDHRLINPNKQGHSLDGLGDPPGLAEELRKLIDSCGAFQKEADSSGSPSPLPSSPSSDTPLSRLEMVMQSFRNLLTNASCNHYARHASNALHLMLRTIICVGMSTFIREAIGYLIEKNIRDDKNKEGETTKRIIFATCAVTTPILMQLAVLLRSNRNGSATYSTNISRGILTLLNASMASVALNYRLLLPNATALTANVFFYCGLRDILQSVFKLNVFYGPAHARRPLSCVSLKSLTMIATAYLFNQLTVNAVMGEASPSGQSAGTLPDMPWENGLWRSAINTLGEAADAATYAMVPMLPTMMARWKSHYGTDIEQQLVTMPLPPLHQLHMTIRAGLPSLDSMINDTGSRLATRTSIFVNVVLASVLMGTAIQEASNEGYFNQTTADFLSNLAGATALVAQYHMFDHSLRFDPNNPATREIEMSNPGLSTSPSIVQLDTLGSLSLNEFQLYAEDEMMETNLDAFNKTASRNDDEKRHFRDAHEKKVALRRKSMVDLKRSAYENQVLSRSSSMSDQDFNE